MNRDPEARTVALTAGAQEGTEQASGPADQEADGVQEKKAGRTSVASRVSAPAPCKRFMERGNKPVQPSSVLA